MKTKNIIIIVCCIILAAFTLGATGVIKVTNEDARETSDSDRLIGVLITREYLDLFDSDRFFNDNVNKLMNGGSISEAERAKYQERLYATLVETSQISETGETVTTKEYVFNGINGIRFFAPYITDELGSYWSTNIDEGITDSNTHFNSSDDGEGISLKGTIYIASGDKLQDVVRCICAGKRDDCCLILTSSVNGVEPCCPVDLLDLHVDADSLEL